MSTSQRFINEMNNNPRQRLVSFVTIGFIFIFFSLFIYEQASFDRYKSNQQNEISQILSNYRANLEQIVSHNLMLMEGLTAYISIAPNLSQQEYAAYAALLLNNENNIRNIGAAKDLIISHMHPLEGNEAALGLNYRENPQQKRAVEKAMKLNRIVIAGPLNLVQGGVGLIGRMPVSTAEGHWGIVSVVLNYESIIENSGLSTETLVNIAIRGRDGLGKSGDVFYGDEIIFSRSDLVQNVSIPYGQWQIVGEPSSKWPPYSTNPLAWIIAFVCFSLWCFVGFQRHKSHLLYLESVELTIESEQKFRNFFTVHTAPMLIMNKQGDIIDANHAASTLYGYAIKELKQLNASKISAHTIDNIAVSKSHSDANVLSNFTGAHRLKNGDSIQVEVRTAPITAQGEELYFSILTDVTEKYQLEQKLKLDAQVFEYSREGIIITDQEKQIISVNKGFSEITGYLAKDVLGKKPTIFSTGIYSELFYQNIFEEVSDKGFWKGEITNRNKDNSVTAKLLSISKVENDAGESINYVIVFSDIRKLKQTEEHLEKLAHFDTLTNLPNRLLLNFRLIHAIKNAQRLKSKLAVMFLDLDRFKVVNDSLGHNAGDELLQKVAKRLSSCIRETDTLARIGGDEFVILLENIDESSPLDALAQEIINKLNESFLIADDQEVHIGTSIGISLYPDDSGIATELISYADAAMYQAKQQGRNTYSLYTSNLTDIANEKLKLSTELRYAISSEELALYYQPQVDLNTNQTIAAEALLRWNHPKRGLITPDQFIQIAEETGLIHQLTLWVITQACQQLLAWQERGITIALSVNISAKDFNSASFRTEVQSLLTKYRVNAALLEFEIVENVIMENMGDAISTLAAFRELGIKIAIDDFGTGYSSLAYLRTLPADKLKIDRSFISDIKTDGSRAEIVLSAIGLAKTFDLALVAEGVEKEYQAKFLLDNECHIAQGYLFSKALPIEQFEAMNL